MTLEELKEMCRITNKLGIENFGDLEYFKSHFKTTPLLKSLQCYEVEFDNWGFAN